MSAIIHLEPTLEEAAQKQAEIREKLSALRRLLDSDPEEQRETYEFLKHALNESRSPYRKVFMDDDCIA